MPNNTFFYRHDLAFAEIASICNGSIDKLSQTITYYEIQDVLETEPDIILNAVSSSGLPVWFQLIEGNVVINENVLSFKGPGKVRIKIQQDGNDGYNPAEAIILVFCVSPDKPTIAKSIDGDHYILTSSSVAGNQWYRDGSPVGGNSSQYCHCKNRWHQCSDCRRKCFGKTGHYQSKRHT